MIRKVNVRHLVPQEQEYDLFVSSLGFEERARFLISPYSNAAARKVACGFASRQQYAYAENYEAFRSAGFEISDCKEDKVGGWWSKIVGEAAAQIKDGKYPLKVCVDVSSMSRYRAAAILESLLRLDGARPIVADFLYSVAVFSEPPPDGGGRIVVCAPVAPLFSGWWTEPEQPAVIVLGLGYEQGKAVGALEYLEPKEVWVFRPTGEDQRYDEALERANANLWQVVPKENVIDYCVDLPFDCFGMLENLVYGNMFSTRVTLLPFGPKIFSICCLLVAGVHWPRIAVWRVSSGQNEPAFDRRPSGKVIGIRAFLAPSPSRLRKNELCGQMSPPCPDFNARWRL